VTPAALTSVLSGALVGAAAVLAAGSGTRPLLAVQLAWAPVVILVLFAVAEMAYVSVEFRRQTYSFTMAGIPLVLGLLALPVWQVIGARVLGAALVLVVQRLPPVKTAYNLGAFAFETAVAGTVLHAVGWFGVSLTLPGAFVVYSTLVLVDLLMSSLLLGVIRLHGAAVGRTQVVEALLPAAAFNAVALAYALVIVVLLGDGSLGWTLLAAMSTVAVAAYRAHTVLATRHESLAQVSRFVEQDLTARSMEELAGRRIARVRGLLRAASAQVVLHDHDGDTLLTLTSDDADRLTVTRSPHQELDWVSARVREQDEAVLLPRGTKDQSLRRWLTDRGVRDAIVVPVSYGEDLRGTLIVNDRLADHATFTTDDVTLLRTLAGHLGVALSSTRLLARLRHDATHDVLTGLANRALLQERLDAALLSASGAALAVLLLDLDGFKEVNDALGHEFGDRLLQVVGERLTTAAPYGATVARLGGDEFAVLLPEGAEGGPTSDPVQRAERLAEAVAAPVLLDEAALSIEASIGVATTDDASTAADLLRHADTAMYAAKAGSTAVHRYTPELDRGRGERLALVADLRLALQRDELVVLFQPKVDLQHP